MFKLMAKINSKAKTLKGINTAIEREFGDCDLCYENVTEEVLKSQGEFKIINKHKAVLFIQDMEIDFVK